MIIELCLRSIFWVLSLRSMCMYVQYSQYVEFLIDWQKHRSKCPVNPRIATWTMGKEGAAKV